MIPAPVIARFWSHVIKSDECWHWSRARNQHGYGVMWVDAELTVYVHRLVAAIALGRIGGDEEVDHLCHNPLECDLAAACPHRQCVNPFHLRIIPARKPHALAQERDDDDREDLPA